MIGEPLDPAKIHRACSPGLPTSRRRTASSEAARAIMTTDTYPKVATRQAEIDGVPVTINGIAKGSGMIAPDMATMLAFVFTDAAIEPRALQEMLSAAPWTRPSTPSPSTATPRPATRCCCSPPARGARGAPRIGLADDPRLAGFRAALDRAAARSRAPGGARTARARRSSSQSTSPAPKATHAARRHRACRSPIRRWSRRRSPARTPIGAASSWRSARPAKPPTATGSAIWLGDIQVAKRGRGGARLPRGARRRLHEARRRSSSASMSAWATARPRSGPAISPPATSTSMPTTGPDRAWSAGTPPLVLVAACVLHRWRRPDPDRQAARRAIARRALGISRRQGRAGRDARAALIRELAEELGIDIAPADLAPLTFASHAYPDFHLLMPLYVCRRWRGERSRRMKARSLPG